jgi:hypothetical protein
MSGYLLRRSIIVLTICLNMHSVSAQEKMKETDETNEEEAFTPHHKLGIILGHAQVFQGRDDNGKRQALSLASWGIDYDYQFSRKWSVGLHTDIITEKFKVETNSLTGGQGEIIERSYPIAPALMVGYKLNRHWVLQLGAGAEFASEGDFFLNRIGIEYGAEIRNGWELSGALSYDIKWKAYDTWILGIGISKKFGQKKNP